MTRPGLVFAAVCMVATSVGAAEVPWSELPKALKGKTIKITTKSGDVHRGRFAGLRADAITVKEGYKLEIARTEVNSVMLGQQAPSHLGQFGESISGVIGYEVIFLRSPYFLYFVVAIPVTAAIGIAGIPVCAIWDLFERRPTQWQIVIIPDLEPQVHR